ncbi:aspergillopepsin [Lenzites betulinus]|nr:aspergillopepsin [Lenzites betulinus]
MFSVALFCQVLLATAAAAIPSSKERFAERVARRSAGALQSRPMIPFTSSDSLTNLTTLATQDQITVNWAGAALIANTATYKSVTGTFTVPTPREPPGGTGEHSATAWVGIDGDTCGSAILQTGVNFKINNGRVTYDAWYEWFPAPLIAFTGISFSAGNSVTLSVTATSKTSGTATIVNHSTGQTVSHTFSGQPALCQENAEWIVEDLSVGGGLAPFANFGTVTFTGATATTLSGTTAIPADATLINMEQGDPGVLLTSVFTRSNVVIVEYSGPA